MGIIRSIPPSLWNKIAEWGQASGYLAIHYQSAAKDTAYKLKYDRLISETDRKRAMAIYDLVCQYNIELSSGLGVRETELQASILLLWVHHKLNQCQKSFCHQLEARDEAN